MTGRTPLDSTTARIAVVGAGAVGGWFAAQLADAGRQVVSCVRRPFDHYVVESDTTPVDTEALAVTDPGRLADVGFDGPVDLVVVAVKGFQTAGAADWLAALCGPDTIVAGAQNGVEEVERLTPFVRGATVVPTVVYCGTELLAPGHIRHHQHGVLIVPDDEVGWAVAPIFEGTNAEWRPDPEFLTEAWRKLGINVMANGITALTRRTMDVLADPVLAPIARDLLRECWAVGRAEGAHVSPDEADEFPLGLLPVQGTSMYHDAIAGRHTEFDELHGAVLRLAARHGIETPVHRVVHALLAGHQV
jgi:2-dehydropantoate 2-reductase